MGYVWLADGRLLKRILSEEMEGTRPRGRPRRRWIDSVRETMMELMQSRTINWNMAMDRGWKMERISFSSKKPKWLVKLKKK